MLMRKPASTLFILVFLALKLPAQTKIISGKIISAPDQGSVTLVVSANKNHSK